MSEVLVSALDARQQKLVENAGVALQRGDFEYACDATAHVLRSVPGCVPARKLQRLAQLRRHASSGKGVFAKVASGVSCAPFLFGAAKKEPAKMLELAESVLERYPYHIGALKLLAAAAEKLGWTETVAFALEAMREIEPKNRDNLIALGEAWLATGRPADAVGIADELLRDDPADALAQGLMRKASVAEAMKGGGWGDGGKARQTCPPERTHLRAS